MTRAVYAGSFDPPTLGHLDVIRRGSAALEELVVAVADNSQKTSLFTKQERLDLLTAITHGLPNVRVDAFEGLAVNYLKRTGFTLLLRGIRTLSDFEAEFQMALTNRALSPGVETFFVMTSDDLAFISSRLVKEAAALGADVSRFVPPEVAAALGRKLGRPTGQILDAGS
ncbi:MAG: pantetheine-phosphate adenylyltransferase [Planctomycetes bacterium]|nr:pantetheine-phosphate adenylyltransferase [Planctomycetota bacterium]